MALRFNKLEIKGGVEDSDAGSLLRRAEHHRRASVVTLTAGYLHRPRRQANVDQGASIEGDRYWVFLAGEELQNFEFAFDSTVSLAAPKMGRWRGF